MNKNDKTEKKTIKKIAKKSNFSANLKDCAGYLFFNLWFSVFLILIVEILARHSMKEGINFFWNHPFLILYSAIILDVFYSIAQLFPKRDFVWVCITTVILFLGITNGLLLFFRITPLAATDFALIMSVFDIMRVYLKLWQTVLIVVFLLLLPALLIRLGVKMKRNPFHFPEAVISVLFLFLILCLLTLQGNKEGVLKKRFANLPIAYSENGFVYCFTWSLFDRGIDKPRSYSPETMDEILALIESEHTNKVTDKPNIIFLQLESFIDLHRLKDITFSEEPQPVFSKLLSECRGGLLTVPSIGAGTANTEFEVLSGMNLAYFGTGEYPYKTVLLDTTCESMAYNLREIGYHSTAIHNNDGTFYDRNRVFANLGFDNFISLEYMNGVEYTPIGWVKDRILTQQIMTALKQSKHRDFIYTISVQDHGKYPVEPVEKARITLEGPLVSEEERKNEFEYYVNQCYETDTFIGHLISALDQYKEPVILVMFGDHLPNIDLLESDLNKGTTYQTEYVIWTNESRKRQKVMAPIQEDLQAYQLGAALMDYLGMNNGILTKYHQHYKKAGNYEKNLQMLQYDMLYGNRDVYGGENLYQTTDMKMGVLPITIQNISYAGDSVYIMGENFTEKSVILKNGKKQETIFIDKNTIMMTQNKMEPGDYFSVAQMTDIGTILSETEPFVK